MNKHIFFSDNKIFFNNKTWELEREIQDALMTADKIIVLYNPDTYTQITGQFHNLIAFDLEGKQLWEAELPTNESGDCYYEVTNGENLIAYSWKSFECEIAINTGKIKKKTFYK